MGVFQQPENKSKLFSQSMHRKAATTALSMQTAGRTRWQQLAAGAVTTAEQLARCFPVDREALQQVIDRYPMRISPYYFGLIKEPGDPLWQQVVPDERELTDNVGMEDPLAEEEHSPVPNITHRYPDRVLFLVSNQCAIHCRFCTRKRKIGRQFAVTGKTVSEGIAYIRFHREVRDVLISGGDPLMLADEQLAEILAAMRAIPHVEIIRIGTRVPCVLPQRVTKRLVKTLQRFHPLYINTHFNHPAEITSEAAQACALINDAGIPLGCQTVLLKGVNDDPFVMQQLMQKLLAIRVKPYYLHQMDLARGTGHFRTALAIGLSIIQALREHTSGMCVPHFVIDLPGGGGKVPLLPEYVLGEKDGNLLLRNFQGKVFRYPLGKEDVKN
jgi:lysine 2,3-aminomutase